ncbi:transposase [Baaleninema simplex]|uniref:transposase n=1 Tax=Baaleninema simplex TaxID=2862350 RepID=UPI000347E41C
MFPNFQIVIDRFHVMKAVNDNLYKIRKQVKFKVKSKKKNNCCLKIKKIKQRRIRKAIDRLQTVKTFLKVLSV